MAYDPEFRIQSPRPETPEPESRQGRRNAQPGAQLLDDDGGISEQVRTLNIVHSATLVGVPILWLLSQLECCLKHIFAKYCTPPVPITSPTPGKILTPPGGAYLTPEGLDAWARDTNGAPFSAETKEELIEFLDVTADGGLTWVIGGTRNLKF